jgi:hypothetical protein
MNYDWLGIYEDNEMLDQFAKAGPGRGSLSLATSLGGSAEGSTLA